MDLQGCYLASIRVDQRLLERNLAKALMALDRRLARTSRKDAIARLRADRRAITGQLKALRASMRLTAARTRKVLGGGRKKPSKGVC